MNPDRWQKINGMLAQALELAPIVRVGADCQNSAYSAWYQPSDLWIADGLR